MFKQEFMKWLVGGILAGLTAFLVACRKHIVNFFNYERKIHKDKLLSDVYTKLDGIQKKMISNDTDLAEYMTSHEEMILDRIEEVKEELTAILLPIQNATLSSHYERLIKKCKYYIQKGEITADELDELEIDYQTYKLLGGNLLLYHFGFFPFHLKRQLPSLKQVPSC